MINKELTCYLIITRGTWGRGKTIADAAKECIKSGAVKSDECSLRYVVGTDKVTYDGWQINYGAAVETVPIGVGFKVGAMLKVKSF